MLRCLLNTAVHLLSVQCENEQRVWRWRCGCVGCVEVRTSAQPSAVSGVPEAFAPPTAAHSRAQPAKPFAARQPPEAKAQADSLRDSPRTPNSVVARSTRPPRHSRTVALHCTAHRTVHMRPQRNASAHQPAACSSVEQRCVSTSYHSNRAVFEAERMASAEISVQRAARMCCESVICLERG